jgi:N-formylglutamate deformylase
MKNKPLAQAFFVTIPHSGEQIPPEASWLKGLDEVVLMRDVDRFVDRLYSAPLKELDIPFIVTPWHRYAVDLNRFASDIDSSTVIESLEPKGRHKRGLHWAETTWGEKLMATPTTLLIHDQLVKKYFDPFHEAIQRQVADFRALNHQKIYHIDAHSMPSLGTKEHRDPGQLRADFVVSDQSGKSCSAKFKDLVIGACEEQGYRVSYNWPYIGGRITEHYGHPEHGHHTIQVEMNRKLYMDESTKQLIPEKALEVTQSLRRVLTRIQSELSQSDFN